MKTLNKIIIAAFIVISFGMISNKANAQVNGEVSFNLFYDALSPYGSWFNYADFGMCWRPNGVSLNWQPYRDGHWMWTDYGWTWVSDFSWGWAPFHYGRWIFDQDYGWIWIPDYDWSPAWVEWRYDANYIGWAPLPPKARFNLSIGIDINDFGVGYNHWNYIYSRDMINIHYRFIPRNRIYKIHRHTTNITNITIVNNHIYNYGPRTGDIERLSGSKIRQYNIIQDRELNKDKSYHSIDNNNLHIYRPEITRPTGSTRGNTPTEINRPNQPADNRSNEHIDRNANRPTTVNKPEIKPEVRNKVEKNREKAVKKEPENRVKNRSEDNRKNRSEEKNSNRGNKSESRERNKNR